jgi:predicted acylesterase/phospholipase RssA
MIVVMRSAVRLDAFYNCAMERRTRAALALGSGGARGYSHIGAI